MSGRVIFVEGIPGAGKTSTVQMISGVLKDKGLPVKAYIEGDPDQPADYEGVALLSKEELSSIKKSNSESAKGLQFYCERTEYGVLVHYAKMAESNRFPEDIINEISRYDIYNKEPEMYTALIKSKWEQFSGILAGTDAVYILDCCLLQNPTTFLSARNDLQEDFIEGFVRDLLDEVKKFRPLVIYLEPNDIRKALKHVMSERSGQWFNFVRDYYTTQAYGKNHDLKNDFNGVISYLTHRVKLEKSILTKANVDWIHIERDQTSWETVNHTIENELFRRL
ncbi:hypothetical protein [Bacillus sp. Marseille-Q1617]|uniref:hypothetical protein n=1 Tax=Bacillus sp. Marseille-Q1617 TaxID=2736887 RepID=UPI0015883E67|nr:hypothetical protein [Bacillus sp. Marseille-Q1617]